MRNVARLARPYPRGLILVALVLAVSAPRASAHGGAAATALKQATDMYDAFFRGDDETFGNYTPPKALELIGGKAKFLAVMKKTRDDMRARLGAREGANIGT